MSQLFPMLYTCYSETIGVHGGRPLDQVEEGGNWVVRAREGGPEMMVLE